MKRWRSMACAAMGLANGAFALLRFHDGDFALVLFDVILAAAMIYLAIDHYEKGR